MFSFEGLDLSQKTRMLIVKVYKITRSLPIEERFGLTSQLQRSIVSVLSNVAEGSGRIALKEKIHFLEIAYSSLMEAYCQVGICLDLNYINEETHRNLKNDFFNVSRLLNGLRNSFIRKLNEKQKSPSPHNTTTTQPHDPSTP